MIKQSVTVQDTIDLLNEMLELDSDLVDKLINNRYCVNKNIVDHPTIQVSVDGELDYYHDTVGLLGVLNGLFGVNENNRGAIEMVEDDDGKIVKFQKTDD